LSKDKAQRIGEEELLLLALFSSSWGSQNWLRNYTFVKLVKKGRRYATIRVKLFHKIIFVSKLKCNFGYTMMMKLS
jgi:hypothetical protein